MLLFGVSGFPLRDPNFLSRHFLSLVVDEPCAAADSPETRIMAQVGGSGWWWWGLLRGVFPGFQAGTSKLVCERL